MVEEYSHKWISAKDSEKLTNSEKVAENVSGKSIIRAVEKTKTDPQVTFYTLKTHCPIFNPGFKLTAFAADSQLKN